MKPLSLECLAIVEGIAGVLAQRGLVICSASDTQYPKLDRDLAKILNECARNSMMSVLLIQDEQAHSGSDIVDAVVAFADGRGV